MKQFCVEEINAVFVCCVLYHIKKNPNILVEVLSVRTYTCSQPRQQLIFLQDPSKDMAAFTLQGRIFYSYYQDLQSPLFECLT